MPSSPSGVGGANRLPDDTFWKRLVNLSLSHPMGHGWSPQAWKPKAQTSVSHLPTANALFSSHQIKQAGNFSEKCHPVGEDLDLGLRLKTQGPLYLFPDPVVTNDSASSYFQSLKRLFRFGQVRKKNKDKLLIPAFLFAPAFCLFLILGFFHMTWWLPLGGYLVILILAALQTLIKNRTFWALPLPLFWILQHFAYSLGTVSSLFIRRAS